MLHISYFKSNFTTQRIPINERRQKAIKLKKKKKSKMSTRNLCVHVLFLMLNAPIGEESCEGEEMGKHEMQQKKGPQP